VNFIFRKGEYSKYFNQYFQDYIAGNVLDQLFLLEHKKHETSINTFPEIFLQLENSFFPKSHGVLSVFMKNFNCL